MKRLIEQLKHLNQVYSVTDFPWKVPDPCPVALPDGTSFERNVFLKEHLGAVMSADNGLKHHYWAIRAWGGIGSFKRSAANDERIRQFLGQLAKGGLTKGSFDCISSLSKVASFLQPDRHFIYDSRVIYALNWLLFNWTHAHHLFPQPPGRSTELAKYDQATIFRLADTGRAYHSPKVAFHNYCSLIRELSPLVFGEAGRPYRLEMLLFKLAPTWTVTDIGQRVVMSIKSPR